MKSHFPELGLNLVLRESSSSQSALSWVAGFIECPGPVTTAGLPFPPCYVYSNYLVPVSLLHAEYKEQIICLVHRFLREKKINGSATDVPLPTKLIHI